MKNIYYLSIIKCIYVLLVLVMIFFPYISCSFNYSLKKEVTMEIKSRNYNVFYQNAPKQVYIPIDSTIVLDTFTMQSLVNYMAVRLIAKNQLDVGQNYFTQHFIVPYFEFDKKAKQLIMYYELKQDYYKKRYDIFKRCTLFPNNIIIFSFK